MENSETIHERITQLVNEFGKGKNTIFASLIGSNEANVRGYKATIMPKFDFLEKIARNIDIDLKWLLTGEGSMLIKDGAQQPCEPVSASSDAVTMRLMDKLDEKDRKLDEKDTLLKEKDAENKLLQTELRAMEKELATLKAQHLQHDSQSDEIALAFSSDSSGGSIKDSKHTRKPTASFGKSSAGKM